MYLTMLDNTGLVWDLQQVNQVAQSFSNSLNLEEIARLATDGLVKYFDCIFARIWLLEPNGKMLRLVASSGLYTHTNGSYSLIPMGAYKIGKIALNRVSLLSNNFPEESWIQDPEWAIAHNIQSFAGYPLVKEGKTLGVLAIFGHNPLKSEFLEVLLSFCTTLTVALQIASLHQQEQIDLQTSRPITFAELSLADSLAYLLGNTKLTVMGTERSLNLSQIQLFLKVAEILATLNCSYCRLTYESDSVSLEAIAKQSEATTSTLATISQERSAWETMTFGNLFSIVSFSGGILRIDTETSIKAIQISLEIPTSITSPDLLLRIQCHSPLLQSAFSQLAYTAGLRVCTKGDPHIPLLTDLTSLIGTSDRIIWLNHDSKTIHHGVKAQIDLSTTSKQLRKIVLSVINGETLEIDRPKQQTLSQREQEVIALLAQGYRDRDIAEKLYISDSTVKFHVNNILVKLEAKTRLQALYKLMSTDGLEI